jgi:membrane-associated phospholipid phosphatase
MAGGGTVGDTEANRWSGLRPYLAVVYFTVLGVVTVRDGVPTGRVQLMLIVIVGLAIHSVGRGEHKLARVVLDWLPFTAVLMVYDVSRRLATSVGMPVHESDVLRAEQWLFGGAVPTVWMQHHFYDPATVHWYDAAATIIYTTHFVATPVLAAILWIRSRDVWFSYISRVLVLAFAGLVTYVVFPEAPPWMAARDHLIDPVSRLSARGWIWLRLGNVHELLENAQSGGGNPVAAMPSLHTAFAALVALFLASRLRSRLRFLLYLYPLAMGVVLIYTGEHYVLDIVAGYAYAVGAHYAVGRWEHARRRRRERGVASAPASQLEAPALQTAG